MTKAEVCSVIDGLWVSKSDREALKYKVRSYAYAAEELDKIGEGYQHAVDEQLEIIKTFASQVVASPQVQQLRDSYQGAELFRQRKVIAARLLREQVQAKHNLKIPADLSREVLEKHLIPSRSV
jgi:hypothetical protein